MTETGGPSRVLLDDFTITVSPTEYALSTVQAGEVRDIAEELVEAAFEAYDWGPGTIYQYMGFTRVESVSFYNEGYSVIRVKGGIVSFDGSSQVVPSHVEIQTMISEIIDPSGGGGGGLTEALQATLDFSYVEETIYDVLWEPTPAPSIVKETTPPPTLVMTTPQTEAPTTNTPLVSVPVDSGGPRAIDNNTSTSSQGGGLLPAIIGVVAGLVLLAIAISLLVMKRRKRARQVWRQDGVHRVYHVESDLEQQAVKSDGVAVHSEAGSSRLGRLFLSSTASTAGRGVFGSGEVTPPQSSDCSTDDDDFSGFDDSKVISVEPIIIPIKDDMNDNDGTQVVQTEVNLEKNIAALVALQIASQQEMKQRKEPEVVAEEGVLFVQSNADDCCINPLSYCGEYEAACLEPVGRRENAEENHSVDAAADLNTEKEVQVSDEAPLPEMKQVEDITCAENDEKVPSFETKEETVEVDHVDESQEDENDSDSAKPILNDETAPLPDASNESNVDSQEDATDIVVQVEDGCASQDNSSEEQEYAAEQDVDLMAIVDGIDGDSDDDDDSKTNTVEEYVAVEVVDRDPINEEGCREVDFEMQVNVEPPEENEPREEERESHETSTRKFFIMSPLASDTRTCGPYNRWSDVSSENSQERQAMSDDDQHEFKPDESWDWDDSTDVMDESFYTPSTLRLNDTMPLLGNSDSFGTQKQVASDETSGSDRTSSDIQESESDATPRDPFRTASGLPANDEEPLLSRLLGTYKLEKVTSSAGDLDSSKDSQERRPRSRSSPPHTKRCTVHLA
jgi:hypothetical protein